MKKQVAEKWSNSQIGMQEILAILKLISLSQCSFLSCSCYFFLRGGDQSCSIWLCDSDCGAAWNYVFKWSREGISALCLLFNRNQKVEKYMISVNVSFLHCNINIRYQYQPRFSYHCLPTQNLNLIKMLLGGWNTLSW